MSTNPEPISQYEAKNVELIKKITQKTVEGKIQWVRRESSVFASLAGGLSAEFVVPASTVTLAFLRGFSPEYWLRFQIKDEVDNSLVAIQNEGVLVNALGGGSSAVAAAQALFGAILSRETAKLKDAIDVVDKM